MSPLISIRPMFPSSHIGLHFTEKTQTVNAVNGHLTYDNFDKPNDRAKRMIHFNFHERTFKFPTTSGTLLALYAIV